jgi:hypothetical protein
MAFLIGLSFLYMSLFFTKADDGRVQDWLVELWIKVESISATSMDRVVAFFNAIAAFNEKTLNRIFGVKLFSTRFVLTSICFSIASLYFLSAIRQGEHFSGRMFYTALFLVSCLIADAVIKYPRRSVPTVVALLMSPYVIDWLWGPRPLSFVERDLPVYVGLLIGVLLDVGFVAIIRHVIRQQVGEKQLYKLIVTTLLCIVLGVILLAPSWFYLSDIHFLTKFYSVHSVRYSIGWTAIISSTTNLFAGLCAFSIFIVGFAALLHKLFWPFSANLIHVVYERRLVENRTLLFTAGSMLLTYSFNWFSWLNLLPH